MGQICRKCTNYNMGQCSYFQKPAYYILDSQIKNSNYNCFNERHLYIDDNGQYGDDLTSEEIGTIMDMIKDVNSDILVNHEKYTGYGIFDLNNEQDLSWESIKKRELNKRFKDEK